MRITHGIKPLKKGSIYSFVQYLLVIFIILDCNTVYRSAYENFLIPEMCGILSVLLLIAHFALYGLNYRLIKLWGMFCVPYYLIVALFMLFSVPGESIFTYIVRFFITLPILTCVIAMDINRGDKYSLFVKISNVMLTLSAVSLFFWIFGTQLHILSPNMTVHAYWGGSYYYPGYFGLAFERQVSSFFGLNILRNQGIFAEAPMFSLCLVLALGIEMFLNTEQQKKNILQIGNMSVNNIFTKKNLKILLLLITIITTFATTGLLLVLVMFVASYLITQKAQSRQKFLFKLTCSIILISVASYLAFAVFEDKASSSIGSHSVSVRSLDFYIGFTAWKTAPLFGTGYGDFMKAANVAGYNKQGFSNSIMAILSQGGLVLFSVYMIPMIYCLLNGIKNKDHGLWLFISIVFAEFVLTLFPYTFLLIFFLSYCYAKMLTDKTAI